MNRELLIHIIQFFVLILLQVLLFNNMGVGGLENYIPYCYVLFILLFPVDFNKNIFLLLCFFLGLGVDLFASSGGIHATACVTIGFIRPLILKFAFGTSYEFHTIKFRNTDFGARTAYFAILIVIHHLILFSLETFNFSFIIYSLKHTLFSSVYTLVLCVLIISLFTKRKS